MSWWLVQDRVLLGDGGRLLPLICSLRSFVALSVGILFFLIGRDAATVAQELPVVESTSDSASEPARTLDAEAFHKLWETLPGSVHRGEGKLHKSGEHLIFDIGEHKPNAVVKLIASVRSQIETPLRLSLTPSCNCTLGIPDKVELLPDKVWEVKTLVRLPPSARDFSTVIRCFDAEVGFEFDLAIVGKVRELVRLEPSLIRLKDGSHEVEARLIPSFPDLQVTHVDLKHDYLDLVRSELNDDGTATIHLQVTSPEDRLIANCECILLYKTTSGGEDVYELVLPVVFIERIQIKPSRGIFRKNQSTGKYSAAFQLGGGEIDWKAFGPDQFAVYVVDDTTNLRTEVQVAKCMSNDQGSIVFVECERSDLETNESPRIRFEGKTLSWFVEVPFLLLE